MTLHHPPDEFGLDPYSQRVTRAFDLVGPSVVHISAHGGKGRSGTGSGVLFTPDGYLLTNSHVIARAKSLSASLTDGQTFQARLDRDGWAEILQEARGIGILGHAIFRNRSSAPCRM